MENNLRKLREAAALSTVELSAKVGATALDLHRIELNRLLAPVQVARRVADALKKPIDAVFPGASEALAQFEKKTQQPGSVAKDAFRRLREAGLEGDVRQHALLVLLRGHKQHMYFSVEPRDADRLFSVVQREEPHGSTQFICFHSADLCVAINLSKLVYIHFLWEGPAPSVTIITADKADEEEDPAEIVRLFIDGDTSPIVLRAEPEDGCDSESERNYLNDVFVKLDSGFLEPHERVHIVDEDGESAFFRVGDIALITAPLSDLYSDELELRDEDGNLPDE
jgi:DNA-binding XRE family transcriptional regulator